MDHITIKGAREDGAGAEFCGPKAARQGAVQEGPRKHNPRTAPAGRGSRAQSGWVGRG